MGEAARLSERKSAEGLTALLGAYASEEEEDDQMDIEQHTEAQNKLIGMFLPALCQKLGCSRELATFLFDLIFLVLIGLLFQVDSHLRDLVSVSAFKRTIGLRQL